MNKLLAILFAVFLVGSVEAANPSYSSFPPTNGFGTNGGGIYVLPSYIQANSGSSPTGGISAAFATNITYSAIWQNNATNPVTGGGGTNTVAQGTNAVVQTNGNVFTVSSVVSPSYVQAVGTTTSNGVIATIPPTVIDILATNIGTLSPQIPIQVYSTFINDGVAAHEALWILKSMDGTNFTSISDGPLYQPNPVSSGGLRDPSICEVPQDDKSFTTFAVAYTTNAFSTESRFALLTSTNLVNWYTKPMIQPVGFTCNCWAPELFVEGTNVYAVVAVMTNSHTSGGPFLVHWTSTDLTNYTTTQMTGSWPDSDGIDFWMGKFSGGPGVNPNLYYFLYHSQDTSSNSLWASPTIAGPYTNVWTADFNVSHGEGPSILQLANGTFQLHDTLNFPFSVYPITNINFPPTQIITCNGPNANHGSGVMMRTPAGISAVLKASCGNGFSTLQNARLLGGIEIGSGLASYGFGWGYPAGLGNGTVFGFIAEVYDTLGSVSYFNPSGPGFPAIQALEGRTNYFPGNFVDASNVWFNGQSFLVGGGQTNVGPLTVRNNIRAHSITYPTNAWPGASAVISLTNHVSYIAAGDVTISGVSGYNAQEQRTGFLNVYNSSGGNINLNFPASFTLSGGGTVYVLTNLSTAFVAVSVDPWINRTNAIITAFP